MSLLPSHFGFPLLTKDLLEQAQWRRMYLLRSSEAFLLYLFAFLVSYDNFALAKWNFFEVLGVGKEILEIVFIVTAWGIYLILPAMTCGAIAGERERETWQLLLVTRLGKRTILLEKYFSRVISALTFLVITIPIMVVAYPLGGITIQRVVDAIGCLFLCILLVSATGICCSAWCKTIAGSLLSTYLLIVGWIMIPLFCIPAMFGFSNYHDSWIHQFYEDFFPGPTEAVNIPFVLFWMPERAAFSGNALSVRALYSIPTLVQVALLLGLAYWGITRPIQTGGASLWKRFFLWLDRVFHALNQNSITRGKTIFGNREDLPVEHPIAWRERSRAFLSSPVQKIRIGLALGAVLILSFVFSVWYEDQSMIFWTLYFLFAFNCVFMTVISAGLISRERSRQTLDVLLVAPISGREFLRDKLAGINQWYRWSMILCGLSLFVCAYATASIDHYVEAVLKSDYDDLLLELETVALLIYLPLLSIWIGIACGMISKSQSRAVLMSLGIICGWSLLSWGLVVSDVLHNVADNTAWELPLHLISVLSGPLFRITTVFSNYPNSFGNQLCRADTWFLINFLGYGFLAFVIRRWCYRNIAQKLGRLEREQGMTAQMIEPVEAAA